MSLSMTCSVCTVRPVARVGVVDTDFEPFGEEAWNTIFAAIVAGGDAVETYYLEAKSTVDLADREGRAKVAKFLLGAANRLPRQARHYFRGHAVMVIGAQEGRAEGVARGTEAHELEDALAPYLGAEFPGFGFGTISLDGEREVVFIIAFPPQDGQPIFPCRKSFQGSEPKHNLTDGAIYVAG